MTYDLVCRLALELPGVEEGTSYGTPALKVAGKFLARLREDGETLAIRMDFEERERFMAADPEAFFLTDHYVNYPAMLVRLSAVRRDQLRDVLEKAWRRAAPERLVAGVRSRSRATRRS